jgi:FkbM family methyltransferase
MRLKRARQTWKAVSVKQILKSLLARTPYRLVQRTRLNRFQAIEESLASLAARGFSPRSVIDGGANTGAFARIALALFPNAIVHAVEPQPGCEPALQALGREFPERVIVHLLALCAPENDGQVLTMAADAAATSTGTHVAANGEGLSVPCRTLDNVLASHVSAAKGALLKLDLQGYELHALQGATETLKEADVILTEVSFYAQAYEPPISALVSFLASHDFELYDVASIYARPRDDRPRQGDLLFMRTDAVLARDKAWS